MMVGRGLMESCWARISVDCDRRKVWVAIFAGVVAGTGSLAVWALGGLRVRSGNDGRGKAGVLCKVPGQINQQT